ncbi:HipA domain-containing protein [Arthrobacter ipis]|uniref:HipA domain-containing protein n=1 Tax=Arthrobacter ipis TaxID=2716202 RepID=UPI001FE29E69|nr:HipA domain-containing protein [Arthrobacter ipis]
MADTSRPEDLDFTALAGRRYLLKLDPPLHQHLVVNEAAHLAGARTLKIPVAAHTVVGDRTGLPGLLVERFDRVGGAAAR